jgi:UDP-GlcNAc:undecaprenyl-phosphate GlcNAc-1-phosphate transferase
MVFGFLIAMSVAMALIPPLMRVAPRLRVVDVPDLRRTHAAPVPRVGGIAMAIGLLLAVALVSEHTRLLLACMASVAVLLVFGIWDDRVELPPGLKLLGQAVAAMIVMLWGGVGIDSLTLAERIELPALIAWPLGMVFIVGATNALNLSDGLDGLAGGSALLCLVATALLGATVGNQQVVGIAIAAAGAVLGFLRYNTHPARVFMGDAGSQVLGFVSAVLAVTLTQDPAVPLSAALPLLLLGMPIIDTAMVMTGRVLAGHSPFRADRNHLHHRLLRAGLRHRGAVMVIYLLQALLFVAAWFMRYESDLLILAFFLAFAGVVIAGVHGLERRGVPAPAASANAVMPSAAGSRTLTGPRWITTLSRLLVVAGVAGLAVCTLLLPQRYLGDIALLAIALAAILVAAAWHGWARGDLGWIDRAGLYVSAALLIHHLHAQLAGPGGAWQPWPPWPLFVPMAAGIALRFWGDRDRRFRVTPLDLLVVFAAVVVPNLPGSFLGVRISAAALVQLVALFYAIECLGTAGRAGRRGLLIAGAVLNAALAWLPAF